MTPFPLTRATALARLEAFLPDAGAAYARLRNHDRGLGGHVHVSGLSAALRRRLISEEEVTRAVLDRHGMKAEKFLSEVLWRTYWKGWLEARPAVWAGYRASLAHWQERLTQDRTLARRHAEAVEARTGIDAFDGWMTELEETGYLHNWARMQFASIWIFTLGLPWELGADLTLGRFADGDPASNTLSWRWVAGLHTPGKFYLADAVRIQDMTGGRFRPKGLATKATLPRDGFMTPDPQAPRSPLRPDPKAPSLLLLTVEDLSLETFPLPPITAIAHLPGETEADRIALDDALTRARQAFPLAQVLGPLTRATLKDAPAQIVTGFAPLGPTADRLEPLRAEAQVTEVLRDWDARTWPLCRKGFFALKEKMPALFKALEPDLLAHHG
ncbi:deoxyribodipyrimidine photolyase [Rhodobacteraceae bacterium CYK-10]|uniref:Deoxyribodipyrimidine photolyase n=2 Tax=Stagnihabitans tardus TaxID=2699202 RepID=A0AAE4Y771_9RHOB|nr:deoxyribodipyrimidine photolyase [Stagnihabitans tardus]